MRSRSTNATPRFRVAGVALACAMALVSIGCSDGGRPTVEEWVPSWQEIVEGVPSQESIGETPPASTCNEVLGFLRSSQLDLFPTPDLALDGPVRSWVEIAEEAFFECPPRGERLSGFADAYRELELLEAEIATALSLTDDG